LLPSFLRWDAWHPIDAARIAAELEITPEELNRALAELVLHGLVLRNDTYYCITVWLLSKVWGRKGSYREVLEDIASEEDRPRDNGAA
jgi:DNA-binding IclR family transcriptional regulator